MHKPQCDVCDYEGKLSPRGWCMRCEAEFNSVMATVKCANANQQCDSPITCLGAKKCVQMKAASIIVSNE